MAWDTLLTVVVGVVSLLIMLAAWRFRPDLAVPGLLLAVFCTARLVIGSERIRAVTIERGLVSARVDALIRMGVWGALGFATAALLADYIASAPYRACFAGLVTAALALRSHTIKRNNTELLLQMVALNVIVRVAAASEYPSIIGVDPWYHTVFIQGLVDTAHLPERGQYIFFPFAHAVAAAAEFNTGIQGKWLLMLVWTGGQIAVLPLVYDWARRLVGAQPAYLGTLIVGLSVPLIHWSIWPIPMAYALVFLVVLLLMQAISTSAGARSLQLVATGAAVITHPLGALAIPLFMGAASTVRWMVAKVRFLNLADSRALRAPVLVSIVAVLAYWVYVSGTISAVTRILKVSISLDQPFTTSAGQVRDLGSLMLDEAGYWFPLCLPILGMLACLRIRRWGMTMLAITLPSLAIGVVALGLTSLGFTSLLADRWLVFVLVMLAPSIGMAMRAILSMPRVGIAFSILLTFVCVVLNVGQYSANVDKGISATRVARPALTESELQAAHTITTHINRPVSTDWYYKHAFSQNKSEDASGFLRGDELPSGYILLRSAVVTELVWVTGPDGVSSSQKLDPNKVKRAVSGCYVLYDNRAVRLYACGGD